MIMTVSCILGGYVSCSIFCSFSKSAQKQHLAPITEGDIKLVQSVRFSADLNVHLEYVVWFI